MRREWDIIKAVLAAVEEKAAYDGVVRPADIGEWDEELVSYQMLLLSEAGFIKAKCKGEINLKVSCLAYSLTWQGHELLDAMKSKTLWNTAVSSLKSNGIDLSYEALKAAIGSGIRQLLG